MPDFIALLSELLGDSPANKAIVLIIATTCAFVPLIFGIIFMVDAIKLVSSSRIILKEKGKGKKCPVPNYPFEVEFVTQCETQGLIRANISRTTTSADQFEPDAFSGGNRKAGPEVSYNYDENDGIPAVDRPLFKPKED